MDALGMIETRGLVGLIEAAQKKISACLLDTSDAADD